MPQIYKVGGCVRDRILGLESKDIDFTFVLDDLTKSTDEGFIDMTQFLINEHYEIFLSTPKMFTIRAKFPKNHKFAGMVADFVMARKEIGYVEGTRHPILELGTLADDLIRRDATLNAMAEDVDGNLIDLFGGLDDLRVGLLRTPLDPIITFNDDPLRILRFIRFSIVKNFIIDDSCIKVINDFNYDDKMFVVSEERIRDEIYKCFHFNTYKTLLVLEEYPKLREYIFNKTNIWLKPTTKNS
jgi:poly(A) polymerase